MNARYHILKDNNLCTYCGKNVPKCGTLCSDCRLKTSARIRQKSVEHINKGMCRYCNSPSLAGIKMCAKHRAIYCKSKKAWALSIKQEVFKHYGGCECICCGEVDLSMLVLDHINNDGKAHRKLIGSAGQPFYSSLKRLGYPPGLQVLCANCNTSKQVLGQCNHIMPAIIINGIDVCMSLI